jgi:hypothetical protein
MRFAAPGNGCRERSNLRLFRLFLQNFCSRIYGLVIELSDEAVTENNTPFGIREPDGRRLWERAVVCHVSA